MGRAIGIRYFHVGHPVIFGGLTPTAPLRAFQRATSLRPSASPAQHGTLDEVAAAADFLIWTMREQGPHAVLSPTGTAALDGKLTLDLNNRDFSEEVLGGNGNPGAGYFDVSTGEQLQANLPKSNVMKAFNTFAMEALDISAEKLRGAGAQVFIAGSYGLGERKVVIELVEELGFGVIDLG